MSGGPWLKFYPTDWRSDPRLRMCSMAARGLWIEMIALMHEAVPYGHLLISGQSPTDAQLAVLAGAPSEQVSELIGELEAAGVFSRTRTGVIYSRKLTRMQKKAATARNNGKNGGNPRLKDKRENPASDNPKDKAEDKPQKPEARSQKDNSASAEFVPAPFDEVSDAIAAYNDAAGRFGWPTVQKVSQSRRSAMRARLKDVGGAGGWREALERAGRSPHLCGQNNRGWTASFDFLTRESSFTKLMEGNYDPRSGSPRPSVANPASDVADDAIRIRQAQRRDRGLG